MGRWDFDTAEEYSDYMSKKEALPKAAFQYGVKMTEGRKTRGKVAGGPRNEKAKLDKEWNKLRAQGCWDESRVREWSELKNRGPTMGSL